MAAEQVDGNDVLEVRRVVGTAVARARAGNGPSLIEALTYRQKGHSRTDPGAYRPPGELERWLERDPIMLFERVLSEKGVVSADELERARAETAEAVHAATERALSWPDPDPDERFDDVYA
jgi:pyruvate dehydrogenase E1 component alpha subunit